MSAKGIVMFLGMNNTRLERKTLIILDFENGFLPTYLPQCYSSTLQKPIFQIRLLNLGKKEKQLQGQKNVYKCVRFF